MEDIIRNRFMSHQKFQSPFALNYNGIILKKINSSIIVHFSLGKHSFRLMLHNLIYDIKSGSVHSVIMVTVRRNGHCNKSSSSE